MITLDVSFAGISMKNPTMLASGMMGETGSSLCRVSEMGAGGLVTKSIGLEPRYGYPNPTLVELPYGYINAMGLPGPGIELFEEEMKDALKCNVPIIGSLFAAVPDDFIELAAKMKEYGASAESLTSAALMPKATVWKSGSILRQWERSSGKSKVQLTSW